METIELSVVPVTVRHVQITTFQLLTFVVAAIGLVLAVASLAWNVAQFLLTGGRAKVELIRGVLTQNGVITLPLNKRMERELARLAVEHGFTEQVIGVIVTNTGRAPVRVQRWGITCPGTATYWVGGESIGTDFPATIEGGAQQTWVAPMKPAAALAYAAAGISTDNPPVHGTVELGTGKSLLTKDSMTFST